eukprot:gene32417-biopygen27615
MTPERGILTSLTPHVGVIALGDKELTLTSTAVGYSRLRDLGQFMLVPKLSFTLLSVPELDRQGLGSMFENGRVLVTRGSLVILEGTLRRGLYYLDPFYVDMLSREVSEQPGGSTERHALSARPEAYLTSSWESPSPDLPQEERNIKFAVKHGLFSGCPVTFEQIKDLSLHLCAVCAMGRMHAFKRGKKNDKVRYKPLECIAVDFKGPFSTLSIQANRGFYLVSDHRTGAVWGYPCKNKNEDTLLKILQHFFNMVKTYPCPSRPRVFHCDDDSVENGELITTYLEELGLRLHVSAPHVHHQNGQVERAVQSTLDKARTLLIGGGAPLKFWDYAVVLATYVLMRTPTLKNLKTPLEILTGTVPNIGNLVPFFRPGLYHVTREERHSTWDAKALPCRFLGYDDNLQSCYKIYCLKTRRVLSRKDCIFDPAQVYHYSTEVLEQRNQDQHLIEFDDPDLEVHDGQL